MKLSEAQHGSLSREHDKSTCISMMRSMRLYYVLFSETFGCIGQAIRSKLGPSKPWPQTKPHANREPTRQNQTQLPRHRLSRHSPPVRSRPIGYRKTGITPRLAEDTMQGGWRRTRETQREAPRDKEQIQRAFDPPSETCVFNQRKGNKGTKTLLIRGPIIKAERTKRKVPLARVPSATRLFIPSASSHRPSRLSIPSSWMRSELRHSCKGEE